MSKTMKWMIGILVGLLVVCLLAAVGFLVFSQINLPDRGVTILRDWDGNRPFDRDFAPWDHMPMRPNRWAPDGLMRGFFPVGGLLSGLLCLGFLVFVVFGVIALVVSLKRSRKPATAAPSQVGHATPSEGEEIAIPARTCSNCQRPVNEDWSHCPYCGATLTPQE
jgi:hypothetical protein